MNLVVYGLPRSGTNYLEFLVINNVEVEYKNQYKDNQYFNNINTALKHNKPNTDDGEYFILLYKLFPNFEKSFKKWHTNKVITDVRSFYDKVNGEYVDFYNANPDKTIILQFEDLIENEGSVVQHIGDKFNLKIKDELVVTNKYMDRSGGNGTTSETFDRDIVTKVDINNESESFKVINNLKFKL